MRRVELAAPERCIRPYSSRRQPVSVGNLPTDLSLDPSAGLVAPRNGQVARSTQLTEAILIVQCEKEMMNWANFLCGCTMRDRQTVTCQTNFES